MTAPVNSRTCVRLDPARTRWLATVLLIDAMVTGLNGVAYLAAAPLISEWLGPDPAILRGIGVCLAVYAVVIVVIARRRPVPPAGAWFAVIMNVAWPAVSVLVAVSGGLDLTGWGRLWAVAQATVVGGFAVAQFIGIRRLGVRA